jgi:hypothetical protein
MLSATGLSPRFFDGAFVPQQHLCNVVPLSSREDLAATPREKRWLGLCWSMNERRTQCGVDPVSRSTGRIS